MKKTNIKTGDKVFWNDPEGLTSAYYIVESILNKEEGIVLLKNKISETEAYIFEISKLNREDRKK